MFLDRQSVRRRRHLTRRLRQAERALLSVAIVLGGLAALYGLYVVVVLGDAFVVRRIVVDGDLRVLTAEGIAGLSGVREGDPLFWISGGEVHRHISAEPWVKAAAVARRLPDTLWISVEEHRPAAIVAADAGLFFVDAGGHPFKRVDAGDDKGFPVFTGIAVGEKGAGAPEEAGRIREMLSLCDLFRAAAFGASREIAEVHFDRIAGYSLIAGEPPVQILLGHASLAERMGAVDRMAAAIQERLPAGRQAAGGRGRIQYLLANEPGRIVVKYHDSA